MGDVVKFRRKPRPRWTRPEDYGHSGKPPSGGGPKRPRRRWLPRLTGLRPWVLLFALLALWQFADPRLIEPPAWLATEPEPVDAPFGLCGQKGGSHCVIDGDTIAINERRIRLIGIDTPETHTARCPAEAALGERATLELQRLLNAGPFVMVGRIDEPSDKYGRELRALSRPLSDGSSQSIAAQMIEGGFARRYAGGSRRSWC